MPASRQVTTTTYDTMGRAIAITQPDGTVVHKEYYPAGQLKQTYGSRTYPVEYTYDAQGRMKTMTTWQNFASRAGAATTAWNSMGRNPWPRRITSGVRKMSLTCLFGTPEILGRQDERGPRSKLHAKGRWDWVCEATSPQPEAGGARSNVRMTHLYGPSIWVHFVVFRARIARPKSRGAAKRGSSRRFGRGRRIENRGCVARADQRAGLRGAKRG